MASGGFFAGWNTRRKFLILGRGQVLATNNRAIEAMSDRLIGEVAGRPN
jgi:hypothetical protein